MLTIAPCMLILAGSKTLESIHYPSLGLLLISFLGYTPEEDATFIVRCSRNSKNNVAGSSDDL